MRPYIFLILLVIFTFANSLQNQFVWDDDALIINNPKINLSLKEIPLVFTMPLWKIGGFAEAKQIYYRPVLSLFYVLNYKIWGPNPLGFHLSNIFLHLIIAIILYKIGLILFSDMKISLLAASIFAVHPINNEPVGRVACGEVIFGFFLILSLFFFLKEKRYLSLITYFLALLSKEPAVMLPFALMIFSIHKKGLKRGIIEIIPYTMLIGIYFIIRAVVADTVIGIEAGVSIFTHALTMAVAAMDYIRLLIIPYPLSPFYPARWYTSVFDVKVMLSIITLVSVCILAFKIRKDKIMLFLLLFPLIMLIPVVIKVNMFPVGLEKVYIAERFLYMPLMLFSLFIAVYISRLTDNIKKQYVITMWIAIITVFASVSMSFSMIWKDDFTLFSKIADDYPNTAFAHNGIGVAYFSQGRFDEAVKEYQIALEINPASHGAHNNMGMVYMKKGMMDEAITEFKETIKIRPTYAIAFHNLGLAYKKNGLLDEAEESFKNALRLKPFFPNAHNSMGIIYMEKGLLDEAIKEFSAAIEQKSDFFEAYQNLGNIYIRQNRIEEASQEFLKAIKINPDYAPSYFGLASAFENKGEKQKAVEYYKRFIETAGDNFTQYMEIAYNRIRKLTDNE